MRLLDSKYAKLSLALLAAAVWLSIWGTAVGLARVTALGVAVLLAVLAVLAMVGDAVVEPTRGKRVWVVGLALLVAPFLTDLIPAWAALVGLVVIFLGKVTRLREVMAT